MSRPGALIITGAAGGIGSVIAAHFAEAGYHLALVDRPGGRLSALVERLGCSGHSADVTDPEGVSQLVGEVLERWGSVTGLIHCVGGFEMGPIDEVDGGAYDRMFPLNMKSLFLMTQALSPLMKEHGSGFIAGMSSAPAWHGSGPGAAVYAASKAAVATFLRSVDEELSPHGVRVSICFPNPSFHPQGKTPGSPVGRASRRWVMPW